MVKNQEVIFGIISALFILIYSALYILSDIYLISNSKTLRLNINKILPMLSKLNTPSLLLSLAFLIPHIYKFKNNFSIFDSSSMLLVVLLIATCTKLNFLRKLNLKQYSSIISYLLIISLSVHIFFR
ncbi:hypothetical protein LZ906_011400 [Paraclostridium ghonii]|uniref:hypothetical protein n=1 Tax=Paraclostridium ghonii TaxID=29358 RepID=UPI00202CD76B|nr:hypothetical protein [Paeniclostridium ghonii]MCM0168005.1 hypothetical protein [Paeniclostridium ghonii]